jgi:hypothetical protein
MDGPVSEGRRRVDALISEQSGPRERVVDEHNFTVPGHPATGTFRVQIFTGVRLRPVAVVTQTSAEGPSLTGCDEAYPSAVWRTFLPGEHEPPIWIQRQLLGSMEWFDYQLRLFERHGEDYRVAASGYGTILTFAQAESLVGCPIDPTRGERFVPLPQPAPTHALRYRVAFVLALPKTTPFRRAEACMSGRGLWRRRLLRQIAPRTTQAGCCWYHGGDWRVVSQLAVRLLSEARRAAVDDREFYHWAMDHPAVLGLSDWQTRALASLLSPGIAIDADRRGYGNGNHRVRAMLDAGVRRTVVTSSRPLPAQGAEPADTAARRWAATPHVTGATNLSTQGNRRRSAR